MICLVILFGVWTVASADPYCGVPAIQPVPVPVPVVGALTKFYVGVTPRLNVQKQRYAALLAKYNQDTVNSVRETGGPGFNNELKIQNFAKLTDDLWKNMVAIAEDFTYKDEAIYEGILAEMVKVYSLVIDQPQVRAWLRILRDLTRLCWNSSLQIFQQYRVKWDDLSDQIGDKLADLISANLCHNPNLVQERYYRIVSYGTQEYANIIQEMYEKIEKVKVDTATRGRVYFNKIYEAEIAALKYFVS